MAVKRTVSTASRFDRTETRRLANVRRKRYFFLIVCEGSKTEPYYFDGFRQYAPVGAIETVQLEIEGTGKNTLGVVEECLRLRERYEKQYGRVFDEVWAVFDRDTFPDQNFNNAIVKAGSAGLGCAWSNEAFELWYLLHFQSFENAMSRTRHKPLLERELGKRMGQPFDYEKSNRDMYALLQQYGDQARAIERAERLAEQFAGRTDYTNQKPCTMVFMLVRNLNTQFFTVP